MTKQSEPLVYKGFPLIRQGNILYYGNITDKHIIMLQIFETEKVKDLEVAKRVSVQLQLTDPEVKSKYRIVKKSEKMGLYPAIDLAYVWLDRARSER